MRLNFYNSKMERAAFGVTGFKSCYWAEGYNTAEGFTVEFVDSPAWRALIRPDMYVTRPDREAVMVIKTVYAEDGILVASGQEAERQLEDVAFLGKIEKDTEVTTAVANAYSQTDGYEGFTIEADELTDTYPEEIEDVSIFELMQTMCQSADIGFKTVRRGDGLTVRLYKPERREVPPMREDFGQVTVRRVTMSTEKMKNVAVVIDSDGESKITEVVDLRDGTEQKREIIIDSTQSREDGETDEQFREKLRAEGYEELLKAKETLSVQFEPTGSVFGSDYDLGDIVTAILPGYGIKFESRIKRFTQTEEDNKVETTVEVGEITILR